MRILFFTFFSSLLSALPVTPWFSPIWEIETETYYLFSHSHQVESPKGSFAHLFNDHEFAFSLGATITPNWNLESEIGVVKMINENLLFEMLELRARRLWLDDVYGDLVTLTTHLSLSFTQKKILEELPFPYHGIVNGEFQVGLGKECLSKHSFFWRWRIYSLLAIGIAEQGCPWFHAVGGFDKAFSCSILSFVCEYLQGFGNQDLISYEPFPGYALVAHKSLYFYTKYSYALGVLGHINIVGFFNVFSRNFPEKVIGAGITLEIPFGL